MRSSHEHASVSTSRSVWASAGCEGKVFRIGHLGSLNELEVLATIGGVEMALRESGHQVSLGSGAAAAEDRFVALERVGR